MGAGASKSDRQARGGRRRFGAVLATKLVIATLLVGLLVWKVDWPQVFAIGLRVDLLWFAALIGLALVGIGLRTWKWRLFLAEHSATISWLRLYNVTLIGMFFNLFLPGMIGGDVARGHLIGRLTGSHVDAYASVFLDRFTGLLTLAGLAVLVMTFNVDVLGDSRIAWMVIGCLAACMAVLALTLHPHAASALDRVLPRSGPLHRPAAIVRTLHAALHAYRKQPKAIAAALSISLLYHGVTILNLYAACRCLQLDQVSLAAAAVVAPIIMISTFVPVTPSNVGIWEWAFAILLAQAGVTTEAAIAVALLLRIKNLALALAGGILISCDRRSGARAPQAPPRAAGATIAGAGCGDEVSGA